MGKTVEIDGKIYNERTINNIIVDGQIISGNLISEEYSKRGELVNLNINIKSDEGTVKASNLDNEETN